MSRGLGDVYKRQVNMSYPENEWLYGYIMSFGEYAEVLEPTYIRDIIKTKIEKMINNYL